MLHVWGRLWNSTFLEVRALWGCRTGVFFPSSLSGTHRCFCLLPKYSTLLTQDRQKYPLGWGPFHLQIQELGGRGDGGHGAFRRRLSFPAPLGVLSCEVPGSDCASEHHCEVFYQELAAQRRLHSGELQAWGCWGEEALLSLCASPYSLNPSFPRSQ